MRPTREPARNNQQTYFVTSSTWGRRQLFCRDLWAKLFLDTLFHYRGSAYLLHEFVLMPDHFHLLITPTGSLERAVQFIKGGFSHRATTELNSKLEIWQKGFSDHRIRDASDYAKHVDYIYANPVRKKLAAAAAGFPYCSACFDLDPVPQRLKPAERAHIWASLKTRPFKESVSSTHRAGEE